MDLLQIGKKIQEISERLVTEDRENFGHWEGDTIAFSSNKYINVTTYG